TASFWAYLLILLAAAVCIELAFVRPALVGRGDAVMKEDAARQPGEIAPDPDEVVKGFWILAFIGIVILALTIIPPWVALRRGAPHAGRVFALSAIFVVAFLAVCWLTALGTWISALVLAC